MTLWREYFALRLLFQKVSCYLIQDTLSLGGYEMLVFIPNYTLLRVLKAGSRNFGKPGCDVTH